MSCQSFCNSKFYLELEGVTHEDALLINTYRSLDAFKTGKVTAEQASQYSYYQPEALELEGVTHEDVIYPDSQYNCDKEVVDTPTNEQNAESFGECFMHNPLLQNFIGMIDA